MADICYYYMDLHQAAKKPDWQKVEPDQRNGWQRLAHSTNGLVTPGNIVSIVGALLVVWGLLRVYNGALGQGLCILLIGRLADIADGVVAHRTGTKGPLGETLDATIDKLAMAAALVVFVLAEAVPLLPLIGFAFLNSGAAVLGVIARMRRRIMHPSFFGKISTGFQWAAFLLYILAELLESQDMDGVGIAVRLLAAVAVLCALGIGGLALSRYAVTALLPRRSNV